MREAVSLIVVNEHTDRGALVCNYDLNAMIRAKISTLKTIKKLNLTRTCMIL